MTAEQTIKPSEIRKQGYRNILNKLTRAECDLLGMVAIQAASLEDRSKWDVLDFLKIYNEVSHTRPDTLP